MQFVYLPLVLYVKLPLSIKSSHFSVKTLINYSAVNVKNEHETFKNDKSTFQHSLYAVDCKWATLVVKAHVIILLMEAENGTTWSLQLLDKEIERAKQMWPHVSSVFVLETSTMIYYWCRWEAYRCSAKLAVILSECLTHWCWSCHAVNKCSMNCIHLNIYSFFIPSCTAKI